MSRDATIAKAVKAHPRVAPNGGTSAPKSAAKGPNYGVSANHGFQTGLGKSESLPAPKGTPAAAPTPYASPLPWDSAYEQSATSANAKLANTQIGLGLQKTALEQEYGLSPAYNDYQSNPYSRAALLEREFQKGNRGTTGSYAARGQLYSGATQNALSANRSSLDQNKDSLEKAYEAALNENREKGLTAENERNGELSGAGWKRVEGAATSELDPETAPEEQRKKNVHKATSKSRSKKKGRK